MAEELDPETHRRLNALMAKIASAREPYWLGIEVSGCLYDAIVTSADASRVYQVWGELTDRYELRPEERAETDALMRRAANEWLSVESNAAARDEYLDRWQYDICGHERPAT